MADRYWRGGTGTWNTTSTTNWSATSGGAGGASVPTASDNVIFDQAATYNVTMTGALVCLSITVSAGTVSFLTGTTPTLAVSGSMSLIAGTVWTSTGAITFNATTTGKTITTGGTTINGAITFNGAGGAWTLGDALITGVTLTTTLTAGTLNLNNFNLTTGIFSSSNTNTRAINFGSGNIILSHTSLAQTVLSMATATGFTYTSSGTLASGTGCFQATMSTTRTFVFGTTGGSSTNAPNLYIDSGASGCTITTGSWFNELNFGTSNCLLGATSLNLNQLVSNSSTSNVSGLTANMRGTGYVYTNTSIGPLVINSTNGTTYINSSTVTCTTCTLTSGTLDLFTNGTLTCSSTFTFGGGSLINIGAINCTTFTVSGGTFTFYVGTITPSVSFVITGGTFIYGQGSGTMAAVPTFTHTAGNVTFLQSYALTATGTYTLTAGTLTIAPNYTLSTGLFSSSNTNTRSIAFGSTSDAGYIEIIYANNLGTVINMATSTGFTTTGLGGFKSDSSYTKTISVGNTAGGATTTAVNLYFTGTGASTPTLTTGSWFKNLDFGDTTSNPGTTSLNIVGNLTLGNGVYSNVTIAMRGSGYLWNRYNTVTQTIGPLSINTTGTIGCYPGGYYFYCTTLTITAGTLDFTNSGSYIICSSTATYTGGTLTLKDGYIGCTTFTLNGPSWAFSAGSLVPSVSFVLTTGSLTYSGTANLNENTLPLFTHTAGTVTLNKNLPLGTAGTSGTYTFTAGTLTISDGYYLQCAVFSSSGTGVRTINFGTTKYTPAYYNYPNGGTNTIPGGYISLYNSTAATTVLNMAIVTNFTYTGSGVFYWAGAASATVVFGTTGGSTTNAPNLFAGNNALTVTSGSWFNVFNIINNATTTTAALVNVVEAFIMYPQGTHTGVTISPQLSTTSIINEGQTFGGLTLNVAGINVQLSEPLLLAGALTLTQGTLTMGTFDVTSATFASTGTATRAMIGIGTNTYNITGSGATAFSNASGTGLTMSGFTINMNSATAKTFAGGGGSFPTLNQGGAGALTITGTNTFYNITNTTQPASVTFTAATTTTFKYFSLSGNAGNLVTITSATAANHTLSMSSGVANTQYMSISRSTATGGAGWIAATSTNGANNSGWVFAAPRFVNLDNISFDTSGGGITFTP